MKIVCFGDSNTWGYDPRGYFGGRYDHPWPEILAQLPDCAVHNLGENGREIPGGAPALPADTDLLIIMLGTNDLLQGASANTVCARMEGFLTSLTMRPDRILLIAPPPMKPGAWVYARSLIDASISLTEQYRSLAAKLRTRFADAGQWKISIAYDGVHFAEDGHAAFAEALRRIII